MTGLPLILPLKKGIVTPAVSIGEGAAGDRRITKGRKLKRERRRSRLDRRKEVRDGIVVLLCSTNDRRTRRDRRVRRERRVSTDRPKL